MKQMDKMRDIAATTEEKNLALAANEQVKEAFFKSILVQNMDVSNGTVVIRMEIDDKYYFAYISEMTGVQIDGEYQMISMLRGLAQMKRGV